jgi:tetratricopeptide (TPR) repeat protein
MKDYKGHISININKQIIKYGVYYLIAITILCFFNFSDDLLSRIAFDVGLKGNERLPNVIAYIFYVMAGIVVTITLALIMPDKKKEATKNYDRDIESNPENIMVYFKRGYTYSELGNYQDAIKDFTKIIELDPENVGAYFNRGFAYDKLSNYQQAIVDYNKVIELDDEDKGAYYNRGRAYYNLGNYQQAINDYARAITLDPEYAPAYCNRGYAFEKLGHEQLAIKDYKAAARLGNIWAQDKLKKQGVPENE